MAATAAKESLPENLQRRVSQGTRTDWLAFSSRVAALAHVIGEARILLQEEGSADTGGKSCSRHMLCMLGPYNQVFTTFSVFLHSCSSCQEHWRRVQASEALVGPACRALRLHCQPLSGRSALRGS